MDGIFVFNNSIGAIMCLYGDFRPLQQLEQFNGGGAGTNEHPDSVFGLTGGFHESWRLDPEDKKMPEMSETEARRQFGDII